MKKLLTIFFTTIISIVPFVVNAENPPTEPLNLNYEDLGGMQFLLSWDTPKSPGDGSLEGYYVNYTINGQDLNTEKVNLENTYTTRGLTTDEYEFWVTAYSSFGESGKSNTVKFTPTNDPKDPSDTTPPVIISGPTISVIGSDNMTISWETDEESTSSIVFDVHNSDQHNSINIKTLTTSHEISLVGLLPCTTYFYEIYSEDVVQNIVSSGVDSFRTTGCLGSILDELNSDLNFPGNFLNTILENLGIELSIESESFDKESVFQISKLDIEEVDENVGCPAGNKPIGGRVYDVKLLEEYNKETTLKKPATITMSYTHDELSGAEESSISMFHYEEGSGWVKLNSCTLDTENDKITCLTDSFSKFMIAVEAEYKCKPFYRDLLLGSYHDDVIRLKEFLNEKGFLEEDAGQTRNKFFNIKTLKALREFQESSGINGLEKRFGFFGPKTREIINLLAE